MQTTETVTETTTEKARGITEAELTSIETMGAAFAAGVKTVRARLADVQTMKEATSAARKDANAAFRKLKSAVKKVAALTVEKENAE
jgi:hypothetical protein